MTADSVQVGRLINGSYLSFRANMSKPKRNYITSNLVSLDEARVVELRSGNYWAESINHENCLILRVWTYFCPVSSGRSPASTAATPVAPPPSTTAFSISTSLRMEMAIHSSETVTILSIRGAKTIKGILCETSNESLQNSVPPEILGNVT